MDTYQEWDAKLLAEKDRKIAALQAQIDRLMLEYCPEQMTEEQFSTWASSQRERREG